MAGSSSELIYRRGHDAQPAAGDVDGCGVMAAAGYSSSAKPPHKPPLGPLRYLLAEQRLVFALVGMAIASLVFLLAAPSSGNGGRHEVMNGGAARLAAAGLAVRQYSGVAAAAAGARVPLGLKKKGLRVVVTGGAGFVGSHLVDRLLARGDSVMVVDNRALQAQPRQDHQDQRRRHPQHARPRQARRRPLPPHQHQRGLRRPAPAPPGRDLLGQRQPHRGEKLLRRGEEDGGDTDHGLPPWRQPRG
ncbi:Os07g0674100 [Oryza sativa Japonica Group]|uniref:Os07g0674100 protein n=1 Tax=Oryza sativa subsp. japonica TaxID=39947 RepID=A0A0P0XAB6_ORYSJ|nr:hypothetical protein EE612_041335 [Oryza sativa]BAT03182.1 Os07g0674100 [Oryza sativa Japonica Group]